MKKTNLKFLWVAGFLLAAFAVWTTLIQVLDVQPIGAQGTSIGLASLNASFHRLTGVNMSLYVLTDWLGLIPIAVVLSFALLGVIELVGRKHILKVDRDILALGVFYIAVFAAFLLFEVLPVNYRPILIDGHLEASYPSSTTMLALCVMPTALIQLNFRVKSKAVKGCLACIIIAFTVFMVAARLISGVHWLTDIVGGALISGALVMAYCAFI